MSALVEALVSLLLLLGGAFVLLGAIGLQRLPDLFTRLHGPTKATTLGIGGIVLAVTLHSGATGNLSLEGLAISLFLFITAPVSAHVIAKAARNAKEGDDADSG
jgi:multicomponent K+:H+ antiporter subunit G